MPDVRVGSSRRSLIGTAKRVLVRPKIRAVGSIRAMRRRAWTRSGPRDPGPGGPILVLASRSNPFSRYVAEILLAEGLNAFEVADVSVLTPALLAEHQVAVLGEVALTESQVGVVTEWVRGGAGVVALRPDRRLAGLLGLAGGSAALLEGYLAVDATTAPGAGICDVPMQFHGAADLYDPQGSRVVATLLADRSTPIHHPAVTVHDVGTEGGCAAAFTFDLARSIVYTRQGNPAWARRRPAGAGPRRSSELFRAEPGEGPDWVDPENLTIPQADEQQRLLVNVIAHVGRRRMPLPRFWYFPRGARAVVVMTGDDHGAGDVRERFESHRATDPPGATTQGWGRIRSTAYVSLRTPLTDAEAVGYVADGFEVALHVDTGCADWSEARLEYVFDRQLKAFRAKYPSLPPPATLRTHCVAWSDWATQPKVGRSHGIRLDANYYHYPSEWAAGRPGFFTGSGIPMRFADLDGSVIDVYQLATQMTDESGQRYPETAERLLDLALGPDAFYAAFAANVHTDPGADGSVSRSIVDAARGRGVPVVSAAQMLRWLDGRSASAFRSLRWDGRTLSFDVVVGAGAEELLEAMIPSRFAGCTLSALTRDGGPVQATPRTVKGVLYVCFRALPGAYTANYAGVGALPTEPSTLEEERIR